MIMLCQFRFQNFNSYRDEAILDMQAASIEEFSDSLIPSPCDNFSKLLPLAAIYGPNAGGKSNAIYALAYLVSKVLLPIKASTDYPHHFGMVLTKCNPFLLDDDSRNAPTRFEVVFRTSLGQYEYSLAFFQDEIVSESLSYIKIPCMRRRTTFLFSRDHDHIELGAPLKRANIQNVSATIPYLSFLEVNYSFPEITDAIGWFKRCCIINFGVSNSDHRFSSILNDPDIKPLALQFLAHMDIPISDYTVQEMDAEDGSKQRKVITMHTIHGKDYPLDATVESEGTRKMLSVLPRLLITLTSGGLFLVDELDAKLHPQLLRFLVKMYSDPSLNKRHAQLIFTCHDLSIMKSEYLRRDEIWFAARNEESSSMLWSLYDILDEHGNRVKPTAAYDRQYLAGRYGADPYLTQMLKWRDLDA